MIEGQVAEADAAAAAAAAANMEGAKLVERVELLGAAAREEGRRAEHMGGEGERAAESMEVDAIEEGVMEEGVLEVGVLEVGVMEACGKLARPEVVLHQPAVAVADEQPEEEDEMWGEGGAPGEGKEANSTEQVAAAEDWQPQGEETVEEARMEQ